MIQRISTKLVLAVLLAVVLPFVAFAFYFNDKMAERLPREIAQQALLAIAKDMAGQLDSFVVKFQNDLELLAGDQLTKTSLEEHFAERARIERLLGNGNGELADDVPVWNATTMALWARGEEYRLDDPRKTARLQLARRLDRQVFAYNIYDLILIVADDGRLVTCNGHRPEGEPLEEEFLSFLFDYDYASEDWFQAGMSGAVARQDQHASPFRPAEYEDPAWNYHLSVAMPIEDPIDPEGVSGVLYALVNWHFVQELVETDVIKDAFRGLVEEGKEPTPYSWVWKHDGDTILAHPNRTLYGKSITHDIELPELAQAVQASASGWGLYPEYRFQGRDKNAAFKRGLLGEEGGFGWIVGVGIDDEDIYSTAHELRTLLLGGTTFVLALAVFLTFWVAKRTTDPILELQRSAQEVANGDLDVRIDIRSKDELGALAHDFNRMTHELKEQRERIVKAEKDAAWREMARQIAHDIKNPLTPISLSLDLLERARRERADGSEEILERTMGLIRRQVDNLRAIAGDFYEFTGGRKPNPEPVDVLQLLNEVLHLHDAWAVELGVEVACEGDSVRVLADLGKLRRVFVNLVSNALQAMPDGGRLEVEAVAEDAFVRVSFRDTGGGLAPEVRAHLFEPYFTTKSEGTGLGLAISKQVIEQMDGSIELVPAEDGRGSIATVRLPLYDAGDA